jgi:lysophospholipase L1-like esterase
MKKIFVLILGLFLALVIFEISLRFIGFIDTFQGRTDHHQTSSPQKVFKILTLGNSYTYGSGAPRGMSYSDQLESLLNQKYPHTFSVINRGVRNVNTSFILENMPLWIKEHKPDAVFIMAGEPNQWNKYGLWNYLKKNTPSNESTFDFNAEFLRVFKVFRFIELLMNRSESWSAIHNDHYSKTFVGVKKETLDEKSLLAYLWIGALEESATFNISELNESQINEAIETVTILSTKEKNYLASRILAEIYLYKLNDSEKALFYFEESLKQNIRFDYGLWRLIQKSLPFFKGDDFLKLNNLNKTLISKLDKKIQYEVLGIFKNDNYLKTKNKEEFLKFLIKINRYYPSKTKLILSYCHVASSEYPQEVLDAIFTNLSVNPLSPSADLLNCANEIIRYRPEYTSYLNTKVNTLSMKSGLSHIKEMLNERISIEKWIISDLEEMIKLAKLNNIAVVIQNYPPFRNKGPREADRILNNWWSARNKNDSIIFMDINKTLKTKFELERNWEQNYSSQFGPTDNHLNERGYKIIAEEMYPIVLELAKRQPLIVQ